MIIDFQQEQPLAALFLATTEAPQCCTHKTNWPSQSYFGLPIELCCIEVSGRDFLESKFVLKTYSKRIKKTKVHNKVRRRSKYRRSWPNMDFKSFRQESWGNRQYVHLVAVMLAAAVRLRRCTR